VKRYTVTDVDLAKSGFWVSNAKAPRSDDEPVAHRPGQDFDRDSPFAFVGQTDSVYTVNPLGGGFIHH
jgi:hypothetical protein